MEIPVYVINGFIESGKTTFIMDTLQKEEFSSGENTLLIVCEDGMEEYDENILKKYQTNMVVVDKEEMLTQEFLLECDRKYKPDQVMVEYNGMWKIEQLLEHALPKSWLAVQFVSLVDASTFDLYQINMRSFIGNHFSMADMVIFNRCDDSEKLTQYRRSVKALNRRAQVFFENLDGSQVDPGKEEMPYDLNAEIIQIGEDDFGLWYLDMVDHLEQYEGKKVNFKGVVYKSEQFPSNCFVPGRFAMTCCADDITFLGFLCKSAMVPDLNTREWVQVTARVKREYRPEYNGEGPVLYAECIESSTEAKEKIVSFT